MSKPTLDRRTRVRQCVKTVAEVYSATREDLDKERKAITKHWAKREVRIERGL